MEHLDISGIIGNPANIVLACEGGHFIFAFHDHGVYETHANFLEGFRGKYAAIAAADAVDWMFSSTDCVKLIARIPKFNRRAKWLVERIGAVLEFERQNVWPLSKTELDGMDYFSLDYDRWVKIRKEGLASLGRLFHHEIDQEFTRHKAMRTLVFEDSEHPYAGVFSRMVRHGQPIKAVVMYNRFALFAQFPLIGLVAQDPLMFNIGDAIVQFTDERFKVLKLIGNTPCQPAH